MEHMLLVVPMEEKKLEYFVLQTNDLMRWDPHYHITVIIEIIHFYII